MSDTPVVPTPLYGLRTWTVVGRGRRRAARGPSPARDLAAGRRLAGGNLCAVGRAMSPRPRAATAAYTRGIPRGALPAGCSRSGATSRASSRPAGAIEVHEDGFRAELARPYVLFLAPRGNARLLERLAEAYRAEVVEVDGAGAVLAFCRERGLGLDESTVSELLGPVVAEERRRTRRARTRRDALRLVAVVAVSALLVVVGLEVVKDPPGERVINGRTGEIHINSR